MAEKQPADVPVADESAPEDETPPTLPPLSLEGFEDISEDESRGILKKIVTPADPTQPLIPNGALVKVHFIGMLEDGTQFESSRDEGKDPFECEVGMDKLPVKAWDVGLRTMRLGERSLFHLEPSYAFGKDGSPPLVPPNARVRFDIEVLSWDPSVASLPQEERLRYALIRKDEGTAFFREGKLEDARTMYLKGHRFLEGCQTWSSMDADPEVVHRSKIVAATCLSNAALMNLRLNRFDFAKDCTSDGLEILLTEDPPTEEVISIEENVPQDQEVEAEGEGEGAERKEDEEETPTVEKKRSDEEIALLVKLFYRRAKSLSGTYDFDAALADLDRGLALNPASTILKREKVVVLRERKRRRLREQKAYGGLFSALSEIREAEEAKMKAEAEATAEPVTANEEISEESGEVEPEEEESGEIEGAKQPVDEQEPEGD